MIEHVYAVCDCRVDGHPIGNRSLSIGSRGCSLLHLEDRSRVCFQFVTCAQVSGMYGVLVGPVV